MTLGPGEVVLIRIDYHQTPDGKLAKHEIVRRLGKLAAGDRTSLTEILHRTFSLEQ